MNVSREEAARIAGVSTKTLERWEAAEKIEPDRRYGVSDILRAMDLRRGCGYVISRFDEGPLDMRPLPDVIVLGGREYTRTYERPSASRLGRIARRLVYSDGPLDLIEGDDAPRTIIGEELDGSVMYRRKNF